MRASAVPLIVVALSVAAAGARADPGDAERLRREKTRLEARVAELEAENRALRERLEGSLAGALEERAGDAVRVEVDDEHAGTTIATEASPLERTRGGQSRHWITLRARRSAGAPQAEQVELVIESTASGALYRDVATLHLSMDGASSDHAVVGYRSLPINPTRGPAGVSAQETVVIALSVVALDRLAAARAAGGTLGPMSFRLTPGQLATIRVFRQRLGG
jgi:hypothetical protein